jgi:lipoate-protein ligase A
MGNDSLWRLVVDGDLRGARNMARDVAMLEAVADGEAPPTVRLYGWKPPCLSLGRHQGIEAADLEFCRAEGIDVVRRPTGGRALLHHLELTYAVIAPLSEGPLPRGLQEAYRTICAALVRAVRTLGVDAELTGGEVNLQLPNPKTTIPCFEAPAGGEVVVAGRKLIGSAMRAHGGAILQHGAILLDWDGRLQAGAMGLARISHQLPAAAGDAPYPAGFSHFGVLDVLSSTTPRPSDRKSHRARHLADLAAKAGEKCGLDDDASLRPQVTTLRDELGWELSRAVLEETLVEAFGSEFGVEFKTDLQSDAEHAREQELIDSFVVGG